MLFSLPFMIAIQEISARIGCVTGEGIAANLRRLYPRWLGCAIVLLPVVANVINLVADLGAMGAALRLLLAGNAASTRCCSASSACWPRPSSGTGTSPVS